MKPASEEFLFPVRFIAFIGLAMVAAPLLFAGEISYELDSSASYVGSASTDLGSKAGTGGVSEQESRLRFVVSPQLTDTLLLRAGLEWQRYSFGLPAGAPIPNTLQSASLVLGADMQLGNSWLMRVEATPGSYGNSHGINDKDFDAPFTIGGSYIVSPDLQWVLGIQVDVNNRYPVLPGAGVRWKFAEKWVLDALLPDPRLEYSYSKALMFYAGADVQMSTYHVDSGFGISHGNLALNDALVDYTEVRVGVGTSWKFSRYATAELETGYMPYRDFKFDRTNVDISTNSGAPYCRIAIIGRF